MSKLQYFTLNNGNKIPAVSIFGTGTAWFKTDESKINKDLIEKAKFVLSIPGVVHIDAAEIYRTYPELGTALKESSKPRNEIWITDKYSKIHKTPKEALDYSLKTLGVDYVDLYLLHDPFFSAEKPGYDVVQAWKYVEELYKEGKAKNIGVSNFSKEDLAKILETAEIKPAVNQIEFNAFLQNQTPGIYDFAKANNILLEAYSPLGPITAVKDKTGPFYELLSKLSTKYKKTESLVLLRWVYQRGVLPITTSSKPERITTVNDELFSFELTSEEVSEITKLGAEHPTVRQYWIPFYGKYD